MQYIPIIIMLVLGCNTLYALDNSLYIRLADGEGVHAMIEVDRMDAGASGDGCVWDFSGAEALCTHKVQTAAEDSVLAVKFMRDIYRYKLDGDVVRWYSFENRLTKMEDSVGVPIMRFPFEYGDSLSGRIDMLGRYSTDTQCMETGAIRHMADARGTLILPDNTIGNVLRVKTVRSTKTMIADTVNRTVFDAKADSLPTFVQTDYRWYSDRFVFPVARRSDMALAYGDSTVVLGSLCLIQESAYFPVRAEEKHDNREGDDSYNTDRRMREEGAAVIKRLADGSIEVQYRVDGGSGMLETTICDIAGRVYYHSSADNVGIGYRSEIISMYGAPAGQYLLVVRDEDDIIIKRLFEL